MAQRAPGRHEREGISLVGLFEKFPDDETAERWFVQQRWPDGVICPFCDSKRITDNSARESMPYRCKDCKKRFSVKTDSVMHSSKIGYQKWAIAIYLVTTSLKGVSSMKLHRDLGITQKAAWHMLHRIREAYSDEYGPFDGEVEVDETYMGGRKRNKHASKKLNAGRGPVGKTAVVGMKDRESKQVTAEVVPTTDRQTLQMFVIDNTTEEATVYTDNAGAYRNLPRRHGIVNHGIGEYVRAQIHTNGVESFWATLKRGVMGTYHHMSPKHLHRYVDEFSGRHNNRPLDTEEQMKSLVEGAAGKRLRYEDLIAEE